MIIVKFEKIEDKLMKFPMLHCEFYLYGLQERVLKFLSDSCAHTLREIRSKGRAHRRAIELKLIYREVGRRNDRNEF